MSRKFVYYGAGRSADELLLDLYPADFGLSLDKLSLNYSGSCIRVRRGSDNQEVDIGFSGNSIDTTQLLNFIGSDNGYVVIWYNQGSSSFNYTQNTLSQQPMIVDNGTLITYNSKPTIEFSGLTFLLCSSPIRPITAFSVGKVNTETTINYIWGDQNFDFGTRGGLFYRGSNSAVTGVGSFQQAVSNINLPYGEDFNQHLVFFNRQDTSINMDEDSLGIVNFPNETVESYAHCIGGRPASSSLIFQGYISECLFYSTDELSNKSPIETNINNRYGIY